MILDNELNIIKYASGKENSETRNMADAMDKALKMEETLGNYKSMHSGDDEIESAFAALQTVKSKISEHMDKCARTGATLEKEIEKLKSDRFKHFSEINYYCDMAMKLTSETIDIEKQLEDVLLKSEKSMEKYNTFVEPELQPSPISVYLSKLFKERPIWLAWRFAMIFLCHVLLAFIAIVAVYAVFMFFNVMLLSVDGSSCNPITVLGYPLWWGVPFELSLATILTLVEYAYYYNIRNRRGLFGWELAFGRTFSIDQDEWPCALEREMNEWAYRKEQIDLMRKYQTNSIRIAEAMHSKDVNRENSIEPTTIPYIGFVAIVFILSCFVAFVCGPLTDEDFTLGMSVTLLISLLIVAIILSGRVRPPKGGF